MWYKRRALHVPGPVPNGVSLKSLTFWSVCFNLSLLSLEDHLSLKLPKYLGVCLTGLWLNSTTHLIVQSLSAKLLSLLLHKHSSALGSFKAFYISSQYFFLTKHNYCSYKSTLCRAVSLHDIEQAHSKTHSLLWRICKLSFNISEHVLLYYIYINAFMPRKGLHFFPFS